MCLHKQHSSRYNRWNMEQPPQETVTERISLDITTNAVLEASRFCLERCGLLEEAQEMALVSTALYAGGASVNWEADESTPVITTENKAIPQIVLRCKGPRQKFIIGGSLVCRGKASVDAI